MTTKPERFPPRGYVDREEWISLYDRSDPGDIVKPVGAVFIPHRDRLPDLIPVMSVEEHEATLRAFVNRELFQMEARHTDSEFELIKERDAERKRAEAAETRLEEARAGEKERIERAREEAVHMERYNWLPLQEEYAHVKKRAEAAERMAGRYREALEWYANWDWSDKYVQAVPKRARDALAECGKREGEFPFKCPSQKEESGVPQ